MRTLANRTRVITEGAASTVLFIVLLLLTTYVPFIGIISVFILPIPIMYFSTKHGYKPGLIVLVCSFIIAVLVTQLLSACATSGFLLVGLVMGELLKRKGTAIHLLIGGTLSNVVVLLIAYGLCSVLFHLNPINWMSNTILNNIDLSVKMSPFVKGNPNAMNQVNLLRDAVKSMAQLAPALIVTISVFYAFIIELISGAVLRRLRVPFPKWLPFKQWQFSRQLVWYYLVDLILLFLVGNKWGEAGSMVFINVFYILEWVFIIQGLAFIYFFFDQRTQRKLWPILITVFTFLLPPVLYIVRILGIIDLGFNFRARIGKP